MALSRPLSSIRDDLNRILNDMERDFFSPMLGRTSESLETMSKVWAPPMDIHETDRDVVLKASIPGLRPDDINVEVEGNMLTITGESREEKEEKERNYHRREIVQGRLYRQVQLPCEVISDKADAKFENGLLIVTMPKSAETRRRKIKIVSNL